MTPKSPGKTELKQLPKLNIGRYNLDFNQKTYIMGVLNRTPDSFYDGASYMDKKKAVSRVYKMTEEGADIIDIGGQSTRPGSMPVSTDEELDRVIPIIDLIRVNIDIPISIDTSNHVVASESLKRGAHIINDVTALKGDPLMPSVVSRYKAGVILMHMQGSPKNMQDNPVYLDVIAQIKEYLDNSVEKALQAGIDRDKILIDPGIGFGKTLKHNLAILNRLYEFTELNLPILIGVSRKSFIGQVLNLEPEERLFGTAASSALAISKGANIIRVHDTKRMREVARMVDAISREKA